MPACAKWLKLWLRMGSVVNIQHIDKFICNNKCT